MPRTKPVPIFCGEKVEHEPHPFIQDNHDYHCQGFVSPLKDPYESLNSLWLPLAPFRLKIASLVKEGNNEYPVGEILRIMKEIIDAAARP